jgi:molybdopterin molybdotransferase
VARQADLLSADDALTRILARFTRLEPEVIRLAAARGRVLAQTAISSMNVPPFANSSMDGFAVVSRDTEGASPTRPVRLRVGQHIAAGSAGTETVQSGTCARIMTGAPLPPGADAVVPFEVVTDDGHEIAIDTPIGRSACVRPAGQDVRDGQEVLQAGTELGAPQIALLASIGVGEPLVIRRPRVAVISTGDELVQPGTPLQPGQIYNSNTPMLLAAIEEAGGEAWVFDSVRDDEGALRDALHYAAAADLILTSGGASVGDYDHVKDVVGDGGEVSFWRVAVRPGKPVLFGSVEGTPIIGLPGNPTSAMVTFELFVRPAIKTMLGASTERAHMRAVLDEDVDNRGGRRTFLRVRLEYRDGLYYAVTAGGQDSAMIGTLAHADGLLVVSEERDSVARGEVGDVLLWRLPG